MAKKQRKFRSDRLYNLADWVVKVTVVLALLFGLFEFWVLENRYSPSSKPKWDEKCDQKSAQLDSESDKTWANICRSNFWSIRGDVENSMWAGFAVAVGLPVVFYGGTRLFNYLFPKEENSG